MGEKPLPRQIEVLDIISSRYSPGSRPLSWDQRNSGIEIVKTTDGEEITLYSNGGQSTPQHGWVLVLTRQTDQLSAAETQSAYEWTLFGISPGH